MFKSILSTLLVFSTIVSADDNASRVECKARCWGAKKAANGITQGIDEVLKQKETKTGAYQKKYKQLSGALRNSGRESVMRSLEYDPVSKLPNFSAMLIKKNIANVTNADMCFFRCGSARVRVGQPIDFMYTYFMTVIASFSMKDLRKAFLYYGAPFDTYNVKKMLDTTAKEMKQDKFDDIFKNAKDSQVADFVRNVRLGKDSFINLRPEE
tara:strand:+ start:74189 stop:74821 length:633 start_codon:yes stop_codon:yes gene_type:complete